MQQLVRIKCHFFTSLIVFIDQHCKPENTAAEHIRKSAADGILLAYGTALQEMNAKSQVCRRTLQVLNKAGRSSPESGILQWLYQNQLHDRSQEICAV